MGCCASSDHKPDFSPVDSRSDNPNLPEEETVKEVMSETPTPKPLPKPITAKIEPEISKNGFVSDYRKMREDDGYRYIAAKRTPFIAADQVSEVSEICSLNDSVSSVTEMRDEDEMEFRERLNRSPAKFRNREQANIAPGIQLLGEEYCSVESCLAVLGSGLFFLS